MTLCWILNVKLKRICWLVLDTRSRVSPQWTCCCHKSHGNSPFPFVPNVGRSQYVLLHNHSLWCLFSNNTIQFFIVVWKGEQTIYPSIYQLQMYVVKLTQSYVNQCVHKNSHNHRLALGKIPKTPKTQTVLPDGPSLKLRQFSGHSEGGGGGAAARGYHILKMGGIGLAEAASTMAAIFQAGKKERKKANVFIRLRGAHESVSPQGGPQSTVATLAIVTGGGDWSLRVQCTWFK